MKTNELVGAASLRSLQGAGFNHGVGAIPPSKCSNNTKALPLQAE